MDKKNDASKGSARNAKTPANSAGRNAFANETDAMHQQALAEIEARGEDPRKILADMEAMKAKLREQYLRPKAPSEPDELLVISDFNDDPSEWSMGGAIIFEESVAAGIPTIGGDSHGRPMEISDVMPGINAAGKLLFEIAGFPPASTALMHGDKVIVDPKAELRDGNLALAELSGHGQIVLRMCIDESGVPIFESGSADIKPIKVSEAWGLRVHGRIIWRFSARR